MSTRAASVPFALALALGALPVHGQTCANIPATVPLFAGTTTVGSVNVSNDLTHLYVTYTVTGGFILDQSALQVATSLAGIPMTSSGDPKLTQFTYQTTNQPGVTSYTYTIPRPPVQSTIYLVASSTVQQVSTSCGGSGEGDDGHEGDDSHHHSSSAHDDHGCGGVVLQTTCGGGSNGEDDSQHSYSGRTSSNDDHHSNDGGHQSDDGGHQSNQCCGPKQISYSGDQPLGSGTYFTYFVNCGIPE
jgi:hypothetical protein